MSRDGNNNFDKQELFAKWQTLKKQDLEHLKFTLTDAQELAAYNEFMASYIEETKNEEKSSQKEKNTTKTSYDSQSSNKSDNENFSHPLNNQETSATDDIGNNKSKTIDEQINKGEQHTKFQSGKITKKEIIDIINEIQFSNTEAQYLASIDPKITDEQIEISTNFEKASDILEALGTTDNLIMAYDYYSKKGNKEQTALIQEAMSLSVDELITNPNVDISANNTYSWLYLINKSNISDKHKIEEALTLVATKLKAYDTQFFGELGDEELTSNYNQANTSLSTTYKSCGYKYLEDNFLFTDDKGKPLKDKSLIGKGISRFLDNGDGKDLSNCQNSIIEMARELVAQDLAQSGLKIKGQDGKERELGQNEYEQLIREKIDLMLERKLTQEGGKTSITQSKVIGKMGAFMIGAEEFKHRARQKGYKGLYEKSTTWLKRLDDKLVERYGNKYTKAKQYAKTLGKVVKSSAIGVAKFGLVSSVAGPVGVAAYIGYNTYKQWKNLSQNWDKMDKTERTCSVIANSVSSAISISMAAVGLDGVAQHLQGPIGTFTSTIAQDVGIWGRTAITTVANSASKVFKDIELKRKRSKITKELQNCKDPKRIQELLSENKKNIIATRQNREALAISVVSASVGTFVGQEINQAITQSGGESIIDEAEDKTTDKFRDQPQDVSARKSDGISTESDTSSFTEEHRTENIKEATETMIKGKTVAEVLDNKLAAEAKNLGNLSASEQQEISTKLQEIYGNKAYMAGTSAMAEPSNIVAELRASMPADEFAKLGFDNSPSAIEVLRVLAENPQLADNAGINKFMSTHFNAKQDFTFSENVSPRVEQPQTQPEEVTMQNKVVTPRIDIETPLPNIDIKLEASLIQEEKGLVIPEELTPEEQKLQAKFDNRMSRENIKNETNMDEIINNQIKATSAEDTRHEAKEARLEEKQAREDKKYEDNMGKIVDKTSADIVAEDTRHEAKEVRLEEKQAREDIKYEDNMEKIVDKTSADIVAEDTRHEAKEARLEEKQAREDKKYEDNMEKIVDKTSADIIAEETRHTIKSDKIAAQQEGNQVKHENNFNKIVDELNEKVGIEETKHQERVSDLEEKQNKENERNERRISDIEDKYKSRMEKIEDNQEDEKRENLEAKKARRMQKEETKHDNRSERITELYTKEGVRHEAEIDEIIQELNQSLDTEDTRQDTREARLEEKQAREDAKHATNKSKIINNQIEATSAEDTRHEAKEDRLEEKQAREDKKYEDNMGKIVDKTSADIIAEETRHETRETRLEEKQAKEDLKHKANQSEIINNQIEATSAEDTRHEAKEDRLEEKQAREDKKYEDNMGKIVDKTSADIIAEETRHEEKVATITEKHEKGLEKLNTNQSTQQPTQDQQETKLQQKTSDEVIQYGETIMSKTSSHVVIENGVVVENSTQTTTTTTIYSDDGRILEQTSNTEQLPKTVAESDLQTLKTKLEKTEDTAEEPKKTAKEIFEEQREEIWEKHQEHIEEIWEKHQEHKEEIWEKHQEHLKEIQEEHQKYIEEGYTQAKNGVYKIHEDGSFGYSCNNYPHAAEELLPDSIRNDNSPLRVSLAASELYMKTQAYRDLMAQDSLSPDETLFVEKYKDMIKDYGLAFDDNGRLMVAYHDADVHRNDGVKYQCTTDGVTILSDKGLPEVEAHNKVYIDLVDRKENETFGIMERDFMKNFEQEMKSQNLYHNAKGELVEVPDNVTVSRGGMAYSIDTNGVKVEGIYGYKHTIQDYVSEAKSVLGNDAKAEDLIKMKNLLMQADIISDLRTREASGEAFTTEQKASITQFKANYEKGFDALRENYIIGESLSGRPTPPSNNDILNAQNKKLMTELGIDPTSIQEGQNPLEVFNMLANKVKE